MAGYTRTDTANNIANGNVINANDLDAEYNAVEASFNASSGHKHDGTAAEGAPITKVGPSQDLIVSSSAVLPKTPNTLDLGALGVQFKDGFFDGVLYADSSVHGVNGLSSIGDNVYTVSSGGLSVDVDGDITLNPTGLDVVLASAGTPYGSLTNTSSNLTIKSGTTTAITLTGANTALAGTLGVAGNSTIGGTLGVTGAITGALTGNASTASKLATSRTITLQGDLTGTINFDGSQNVTATVGVNDDSHSHIVGDIDNLASTINTINSTNSSQQNSISSLTSSLNNKVSTSTQVFAGAGLTGGGSLVTSRTISHADTSSQNSVDNSGTTFIQDISLDAYGHITSIGSASVPAQYSLPTASSSTLGGIKIGSGLSISSGVVSANTTTNLSITQSSTNIIVNSSTGTNATIPIASVLSTNAGLMTGNDKYHIGKMQQGPMKVGDTTNYLGASASGDYSTSIGTSSAAIGYGTVAIGRQATAWGDTNAQAADKSSVAIGNNASVMQNSAGGVAIGDGAIAGYNSIARENSIAIGCGAGSWNSNSIAIGMNSGISGGATDSNGTNNVAIGQQALIFGTNATGNSVALGFSAQVTTPDTIRLGNASIQALLCQDTAISTSDVRDKTDFEALNYGLDFVKAIPTYKYKRNNRGAYYTLAPNNDEDGNRVYTYDEDGYNNKTKKLDRVDFGFKAQEVEALIQSNERLVSTTTEPEGFELKSFAHSDMTPILWKAVQELSAKNDALEARIVALES